MGCVQTWGVHKRGVCTNVGCVQTWGVYKRGVCTLEVHARTKHGFKGDEA